MIEYHPQPIILGWKPFDPATIKHVPLPKRSVNGVVMPTDCSRSFVCFTDWRILWACGADGEPMAVFPCGISRYGVGKTESHDHLTPLGLNIRLAKVPSCHFVGDSLLLSQWGSDLVKIHGPKVRESEDSATFNYAPIDQVLRRLAQGNFDTTQGCIALPTRAMLEMVLRAWSMGCNRLHIVGHPYRRSRSEIERVDPFTGKREVADITSQWLRSPVAFGSHDFSSSSEAYFAGSAASSRVADTGQSRSGGSWWSNLWAGLFGGGGQSSHDGGRSSYSSSDRGPFFDA